MTEQKKKGQTREERQAQALRQNLRKRKSQQRERLLTTEGKIDYKNEGQDPQKKEI